MSNTTETQTSSFLVQVSKISQNYLLQERKMLIEQAQKQEAFLNEICTQIDLFLKSSDLYQNMGMTLKASPTGDFSYAKGWKIEFTTKDRLVYKHTEIGSAIITKLKNEGKLNSELKEQAKQFQGEIENFFEALKMIKPVSGYTLFEIGDNGIRLQVIPTQNGHKIV